MPYVADGGETGYSGRYALPRGTLAVYQQTIPSGRFIGDAYPDVVCCRGEVEHAGFFVSRILQLSSGCSNLHESDSRGKNKTIGLRQRRCFVQTPQIQQCQSVIRLPVETGRPRSQYTYIYQLNIHSSMPPGLHYPMPLSRCYEATKPRYHANGSPPSAIQSRSFAQCDIPVLK